LIRRKRDTQLWITSALCIAISAANPNGLAIFRILLDYRASFMQSKLLEWAPPRLWPLSWFSGLLLAGAAALVVGRRQARPADWLLFLAFAAASLTAQRNVFLTAIIAPVLVVSYMGQASWLTRFRLGRLDGLPHVATLLIASGIVAGVARGTFFQPRVAD